MDETQNDKRSRNVGLLATILFHGGIALLFFLLMAWTAPNPPHPEYGVEINLGFSDVGSGDVQSDVDPGNEGTSEETPVEPEPTQPKEVKSDPVEEQPEQQPVVTDESNPVSVKSEPKVQKEEIKPVVKKEVTPKETTKPEVKQESLYTPKETNTTKKQGENKSEGDDTNKAGNKGQPNGTLDPNAQYTGTPGGGDNGKGFSISLSGWRYDKEPKLPPLENESGKVVFEIHLDDQGEIIFLQPIERGLSDRAIDLYRAEIQKLTFSQVGATVPEVSKGRITINVRAK